MSGSSIQQSGSVTPGHPAVWVQDGVCQDAGPATSGILGELGLQNNGGIAFGINNVAPNNPNGYTQFGISVAQTGTITLYAESYNGAPPAVLNFNINGLVYPFALSGNVTGPSSSVNGDLVSFSGTTGVLIADAGINVTGITISVATIAALRAAMTSSLPQQQVFVLGYAAFLDGGQGAFYVDASDVVSADNGGTIIVDVSGRRWYRQTGGGSWSVKWFGAKGDGSTVDTAAFTNAIGALLTAGAGVLFCPPGTYIVSAISVPNGITIQGARAATTLKLAPGAETDVIVSQGAWAQLNRRITATVSSGATSVTVSNVTGISVGDTMISQANNGIWYNYSVGSISGATIGIAGSLTLPGGATLAVGAPALDATTIYTATMTIRDLTIDGNVSNQPAGPSNICLSQTAAPGSLSINGGLAIGGTAYLSYASNQYLIITTTAANTATVTITGTRIQGNYTSSGLSETVTLGAAGAITTNNQYVTVTSVVANAAITGQISVGAADGTASCNGITVIMANPIIEDVYIQNARGWGVRMGFTTGFNDIIPYMTNVAVNSAWGLAWINANDCRFSRLIGNFLNPLGIWWDRESSGSMLDQAHVSGAYTGTVAVQPAWGMVVDGDTVNCTDVNIEESVLAQVLVRANNFQFNGGNVFYTGAKPNDTTESAGFQIGDTTNGFTGIEAYDIVTRAKNCSAGAIDFVSDGGYGRVRLTGYDQQSTVASNALSGATSITLNGDIAAFGAGNNVVIQLNGPSYQQVNLTAYNQTTGVATISPALSGAANGGNKVYRGRSITGTLATGAAQSDIQINMIGTFPQSFIQAIPNVYTVAFLPSASFAVAGARAFVSDATATTFGSNVSGGGSNFVPVFFTGTTWVIG
jgi:hypothetical protein